MSTGIGASLREAREVQGSTLEEAARSLRARVTQLRALEEEDFATFGGDVYAKGFLKSYAVHLGLDPQPLLDTYRREVAHDDVRATTLVGGPTTNPPKQRVAPPAWIAWVLVSVVVIAGVFVVGLLDGGGRAPLTAPADTPPGPPPAPAPSDDDTDVDEPSGDGDGTNGVEEDADAQDPVEEEEPEPPTRVDLVLALEERSWMQILVDGSLALEETVQAGETLQFDGDQEIRIRFGNAGGVRAQLNGEDLGAQGGRGDVVDVRFTPEGRDVL